MTVLDKLCTIVFSNPHRVAKPKANRTSTAQRFQILSGVCALSHAPSVSQPTWYLVLDPMVPSCTRY